MTQGRGLFTHTVCSNLLKKYFNEESVRVFNYKLDQIKVI